MLTLRLHPATPSWHCGVPVGRWRKVVTREGDVAIEAKYTAEEFAWMLACCPQVPLIVALRALELVEREGKC